MVGVIIEPSANGRMGTTSETEGTREKRERFLQIAYDLSIDQPIPWTHIEHVAQELGMDPDMARSSTSEAMKIARYWGNKGYIKSQADGYGIFSLTPRGIDAAEGNEAHQPSSVSTVFNMSGSTFHGSVVGTNNTAELVNNFDLRSVEIEQQIEEHGGADKQELRDALAEVRQILASEDSLERGRLARFSGVMERHSWFTGAIAQAIAGFATQAIGG